MSSGLRFRRIAVANRGEPAMRLIHGVREWNAQHDDRLCVIALHTEAERHAMFVREADEAVLLRERATPDGPRSPYLDYDALQLALLEARAEAVWVGWGFVAEDPDFADLCARLGVVFIGPDGEVMRRLGDKIGAKLLAEKAGVPVAPWSGGAVETVEEARRHADDIGYPLMIKAAAGGGGRGIRRVDDPDQLDAAFISARAEASSAFGDPRVFLERMVAGGRHVEVQIVADEHDTVWALGVRDCSVQRRNQKVIEESASTALDAEQEQALREGAVALARAAGYRNAGTVEFLHAPDGTITFLEVNTRLQVEHTVTEAVTGADLVKLQLLVAQGGRLGPQPPAASGHAIEARLNAEDPARGFAPAPGLVELLQLPSGPGVRVDTGTAEGDTIPGEYDSMVAKVIAWGSDRDEALARLRRALAQTTVVLRGGTTNRSFLLELVDHPDLRAGRVDTSWLDRLTDSGAWAPTRHAEVALLAAAVEAYDSLADADRARFYASAVRGRPKVESGTGHTVELRYRDQPYHLHVAQSGPRRYQVTLDDDCVDLEVERLRHFTSRVTVGGASHQIRLVPQGSGYLVEVDDVSHRVSRDDGGIIRAMAPAVVVATLVQPGDQVEAGAAVAVLESMKMELTVTAPFAGIVREVLVASNMQVDAGAALMRLEGIGNSAGTDCQAERLSLAGLAHHRQPAAAARAACLERLEELRWLVLGFDVTAAQARSQVEDYLAHREQLPAADPEVLRAELEVLETFADICLLSRNRPRDEGDDSDATTSEQERFHAYLHSLDVDAEGLPESFREKLRRALRHYGVEDLDRTPQLEQSLYWMFQAQQRTASQVPVIVALLERWLQPAEQALDDAMAGQLRETLDLLIAATQLRHPVVGELARSVRFRALDEPLLRATRAEVYARMREHLEHLTANPDAPDRRERMDALVACPQPLVRLLAERGNGALPPREPMLEVLVRRYYKIRPLEEVRAARIGGRQVVTAEYGRDHRRVGVLAVCTDAGGLHDALTTLAELAAQPDAGVDHMVADCYVWQTAPPADDDVLAASLQQQVATVAFPAALQRVAVIVLEPDGNARHVTFERSSDAAGGAGEALVENRLLRGMHPMIARRLQLWRLANFSTRRLPSVEDVHVLHCTARDNPKDERFIALAEVRDLTPVRDAEGRVVALPELEHVLAGCLDGLRRAQAGRPQDQRLHWNRVLLYVWPTVEAPLEELLAVAKALAPSTVGLGLEAVLVQARLPRAPGAEPQETVLRISASSGTGVTVGLTDPPTEPLKPLDEYTRKVLQTNRRGQVYPYEIIPLLTRSAQPGASGEFTELDLDEDGRLRAVDRPYGRNTAGIVVGIVRTPTPVYPEGMTRVALLGDPTRALGAVAEPECRRIIAALDLAEQMDVPVEWFAVSAGAKVSMDSGTENLDWVGAVLRRLISFTQAGGEVNVVVTGINVGAQSYWNAEATMMMHSRGILVMTPESAMVLTGKQALEYSGAVSAEENVGIGGYERIMGPNGEASHWAPDVAAACELLLRHYEHAYAAPGERFPRRAPTSDPFDRDVRLSPHHAPGSDFTTVGDIFSDTTNPGRKKPFDIRAVLYATADADRAPLERWAGMADAESAVVLDAHLGGRPVTLLGVESRPLPRSGFLPADGPDQWTAGTLFPLSSKKVARALNAASGNRPVVVLANLSGFDGSPESMRKLQLEYGAEIARAVVNFDGPIVFCVISRYHGGAFAVFANTLNDNMKVAAVEGSYASVIGGAPAAAVVFASEVRKRTLSDPRVRALQERIDHAPEHERARLRTELAEVTQAVRSQHLGELAAEFDAVHSVERARQVGSVHDIIPGARLRPYLIEAVEAGIARVEGKRS